MGILATPICEGVENVVLVCCIICCGICGCILFWGNRGELPLFPFAVWLSIARKLGSMGVLPKVWFMNGGCVTALMDDLCAAIVPIGKAIVVAANPVICGCSNEVGKLD